MGLELASKIPPWVFKSWICIFFPNRILDEAKNLSFNATIAFKAYSNIKDHIDEADAISKDAKARANEAIQLVRERENLLIFSNNLPSVSCYFSAIIYQILLSCPLI